MKNKLIKLLGGYTKENVITLLDGVIEDLNKHENLTEEQLYPLINNALELLDKNLLE